jgi:hypothetical protein
MPPLVHEEKPWIELFQEAIVCGAATRLTFERRPDYRILVSEMTVRP